MWSIAFAFLSFPFCSRRIMVYLLFLIHWKFPFEFVGFHYYWIFMINPHIKCVCECVTFHSALILHSDLRQKCQSILKKSIFYSIIYIYIILYLLYNLWINLKKYFYCWKYCWSILKLTMQSAFCNIISIDLVVLLCHDH